MRKAYYMKTRKMTDKDRKQINLDKIGGVPTHKPPKFSNLYQDEEMGFIMQIYNDNKKFTKIEGVLCWHIYQDLDEEEEPILVEVPLGSELNTDNEGIVIERLEECVIYYEEGLEPDVLDITGVGITTEEEKYYSSKIGGAIPEEYLNYDKRFLGCIKEYICDYYDLNLGGGLYLLQNREGHIEMEIY